MLSLGDIDDDGTSDFAISAPGYSPLGGPAETGAVHIIFTGTESGAATRFSASEGGFSFSMQPNKAMGAALAVLGPPVELEGEGESEGGVRLAVGCPECSPRGIVFIVHVTSDGSISTSSPQLALKNADTGLIGFGIGIAAVGDVFRDGGACLLVGDSSVDPLGFGGISLVRFSQNGSELSRERNSPNGTLSGLDWDGLSQGQGLGHSMAVLGPTMDDETLPMVLGLPFSNRSGFDGGGSAAFFGLRRVDRSYAERCPVLGITPGVDVFVQDTGDSSTLRQAPGEYELRRMLGTVPYTGRATALLVTEMTGDTMDDVVYGLPDEGLNGRGAVVIVPRSFNEQLDLGSILILESGPASLGFNLGSADGFGVSVAAFNQSSSHVSLAVGRRSASPAGIYLITYDKMNKLVS